MRDVEVTCTTWTSGGRMRPESKQAAGQKVGDTAPLLLKEAPTRLACLLRKVAAGTQTRVQSRQYIIDSMNTAAEY